MVLEDFSSIKQLGSPKKLNLAPGLDRVLAFLFDLILFAPFFIIFLSQLIKRLETQLFLSPNSAELKVLIVLTVLGFAILTFIAQGIFVFKFGATPGKMIFKIQIVGLNGQPPTLSMSFLRAGLWLLEWGMLGIPFLEIFAHPQRRTLHDRASETIAITLKKQVTPTPNFFEIQFVHSLMTGLLSGIGVLACFALFHSYQKVIRGDLKRTELVAENYLCSDLDVSSGENTERLDIAIARFLLKDIDGTCLLRESDFVYWNDRKSDLTWAALAKAVYYDFDREKSELYLETICTANKDRETCDLAKRIKNRNFADFSGASITGHVLKAQYLWDSGKFDQFEAQIDDVSEKMGSSSLFTVEKVKAMWMNRQTERAYGAYVAVEGQLKRNQRVALQAWMCRQELFKGCKVEVRPSCLALKRDFKNSANTMFTNSEVYALIKDRECMKLPEPSILSFHQIFEVQPALRNLSLAISRDSSWEYKKRIDTLRSLVKEPTTPADVRRLAEYELVEMTNNGADLVLVQEKLKEHQLSDDLHFSTAIRLQKRASDLGFKGVEAARMPSSSQEVSK